MASRRNLKGWGVLTLAAGAVLVTTAAQPPASPRPGQAAAQAVDEAIVSLSGCASAGGLCATARHTVVLSGGPALTGRPFALDATRAPGPIAIALRTPGRLTDVTVTDRRGRRVAGRPSADGTRWTSTAPLLADGHYTAHLTVERARPGGHARRAARLEFRTGMAPEGERLSVAFGPSSGRTYGVGQPVTAELSHPVPAADPEARRVVERALDVRSEPRVVGAWHWVRPTTLHYRPRAYWPAHTTVRVRSGLDGVRVTDRLHGGPSNPLTFTTGDRVEAVTDVATLRMTVKRDGRILRTIPVTTGKAGFRTRGGIKVVLGKEPTVRMRGDSIGIPRRSRDYYDLKVRWATRVTWSGEYLHAAPWSTDAQGSENVSHGCTGMSTEDAAWLFRTVREGDLVEVINGYGAPMTPFGNGYGDWNLTWSRWQQGSAFGTEAGRPGRASGALRPDL
ncbi:L,D-transpeptidase [Streptomyces vilmorinianum]|uniref:L,D-transpeptidase n=1 Tax=Streptomyces vilmorinianum TaxID=3051092 RepID=UPI0010FB5AB5|nr:Ig-like domain-containing protein [Streptomyces vilmorinianum]